MPSIFESFWELLQGIIEATGLLGASAVVMAIGVASLFVGRHRL